VKRFSRGLQLNGNYTFGKALDDQSSLAEVRTQDMYNHRADWGRSSIDIRHIFQLAYLYELPFGKGRRFGGGINRAADLLLGGWSLEGITRLQSGAPVNVTTGQDRANVGRSSQRPDLLRNPNVGGNRNADAPWFDISAFALPAIYTFGNAGSFVVDADGRQVWDMAAQKDFKLRENQIVQFRSEFYNMPNHVNFGSPNSNFSSTAFGKVTGATSARQIQFALRYQF
jgi:hypothetical protein